MFDWSLFQFLITYIDFFILDVKSKYQMSYLGLHVMNISS